MKRPGISCVPPCGLYRVCEVQRLPGLPGRRAFFRPDHGPAGRGGGGLPANLREKGIVLGTHIARCKDEEDTPFSTDTVALLEEIALLGGRISRPYPGGGGTDDFLIEQAHSQGDSVGGILETIVVGVPAGVGEPFFGSVESVLSQLLFSVPAVKGVEFGLGFGFADQFGSQANDPFRMEGDRVVTATNHNGGINGGITNGMPICFRTAVKPTPSIYQKQQTVDIRTRQNTELVIQGRHDPAILHRARVVVDSVTAIGLVDLLAQQYGCTWMAPDAKKEDK